MGEAVVLRGIDDGENGVNEGNNYTEALSVYCSIALSHKYQRLRGMALLYYTHNEIKNKHSSLVDFDEISRNGAFCRSSRKTRIPYF